MKLYRIKSGIVIEKDSVFYLLKNEQWDHFVNDDQLFAKMTSLTSKLKPEGNGSDLIKAELIPPIQSQEIWAAGVTYYRSKVGRQEESKTTGGADFYARVYEA